MNELPATIAAIKKDPGPIPDLHPPRDQMAIDLPEKAILIGALAFAFAVLILGRVLRRAIAVPPLPPEHPASIAHHALAALTPDSAPSVVAATCGQATREYVRAAFALGDEALTTSEMCTRYASHPLADTNSTSMLHAFLADCEQAQFAPEGAHADPQIVERFHSTIDSLEQQRKPVVVPPPIPPAT